MTTTAARWLVIAVAGLSSIVAGPAARAQTPADQILLKDYRPKSIYKVPETLVRRARYPILDLHSHPYAETPEEIDRWVKTMDEVGVEKTMVLTMAVGKKFDEIAARYRKHPDRFAPWCGFDFTGYDKPGYGPAAVAELERCHAAGAVGVGELGDKGKGLFYGDPPAFGMHVDDPRMDPLLEKCADLGMPVSVHVAEPIWMYQPMDASNDGLMNAYEWRLDNQPGIVGHQGMVETLRRAAKRHPRTTFIACHFANCCYDLTILGRLLDECPNLYADIAARYAETAAIPRFAARFIEKYQDRLVYGTDMGLSPDMYRTTFRILETEDEHFYDFELFTYHWPLSGFGLSDAALKKVYRENALRVFAEAKAGRGDVSR
jgi:predicted TIM-barrel fold metal-dependent hydrolase